jgi:hypothetical protein
MSALLAETVLLPDTLHLLLLFVETLTYLEPELYMLMIFYNNCTPNIINCIQDHTHISSHHIMVDMTALNVWLCSKRHTFPFSGIFVFCEYVCVLFTFRPVFTV